MREPSRIHHIKHVTMQCHCLDVGRHYYVGSPLSPEVCRFLGGQMVAALRKDEWTPSPKRGDAA